jgi:hypothetical protein
MPQFDTFIFSSSLFYFIVSFFILLYCNFTHFLPRLSAILKLRSKLSKKSAVISETQESYKDNLSIFSRHITISNKN